MKINVVLSFITLQPFIHTAKSSEFCVYYLLAKLYQRSYENAFHSAKPNNLLPRNTESFLNNSFSIFMQLRQEWLKYLIEKGH